MVHREKMLDAPQTFGWDSTWSLVGQLRVERTTLVPDETVKSWATQKKGCRQDLADSRYLTKAIGDASEELTMD
jgi:hypothetical protein